MSLLTPSASSGLIAGAGFWGLVWSMVFHLDTIAEPVGMKDYVSKDGTLDWCCENPTLSLIGTEIVNIGMHGVSNPSITSFVLGGTLMNATVLYGVLQLRKAFRKRKGVSR